MLQPLLVRVIEEDKYEVIAGARRLRAANLAALEEVPVRVVELSDAACVETQLVENIQRENAHPLEEAFAFYGVPEQSRIVFFVGAGVSVGAGYPLWREATKQALEQAEKQGLEPTAASHARTKLSQELYYQVFEILQDQLPTPTFHNIAQTVFSGHDKLCQTHHLLTKVKCRGIITTNFDNCLEEAAIREGREMPLQDFAQAMASDKVFVAKPHGSISVPRTMVLSTSDWRRVEENSVYRELLAQCVGANQFIFLGYSMRDPDFNRMWDQLLQERTFRYPADYCCAKSDIENSRREAFRSRNIQVLEFVDDGTFAFINRALEALAQPMSIDRLATQPIITEAERIAQELERYVLISLLFSPAQQSRLVLVAKALILEFFVATGAENSPLEPIFRYATAALGQDSLTIRQAVEAAIQELGKARIVQSDGSHIEVDRRELTALNEEALRFDRAQSDWVKRALSFQSESIGLELEPNDSANIDQLLKQVLMESGKDVAELFLFNRPPRDELTKIEDVVDRFCKEKGLAARQTLYKKTIRQMVLDPGGRRGRHSLQEAAILLHRKRLCPRSNERTPSVRIRQGPLGLLRFLCDTSRSRGGTSISQGVQAYCREVERWGCGFV